MHVGSAFGMKTSGRKSQHISITQPIANGTHKLKQVQRSKRYVSFENAILAFVSFIAIEYKVGFLHIFGPP